MLLKKIESTSEQSSKMQSQNSKIKKYNYIKKNVFQRNSFNSISNFTNISQGQNKMIKNALRTLQNRAKNTIEGNTEFVRFRKSVLFLRNGENINQQLRMSSCDKNEKRQNSKSKFNMKPIKRSKTVSQYKNYIKDIVFEEKVLQKVTNKNRPLILEDKHLKRQNKTLFVCKVGVKYSQVIKASKMATLLQNIHTMKQGIHRINKMIKDFYREVQLFQWEEVAKKGRYSGIYCKMRVLEYMKEILLPMNKLMVLFAGIKCQSKEKQQIKNIAAYINVDYELMQQEQLLQQFQIKSIGLAEIIDCNLHIFYSKQINSQSYLNVIETKKLVDQIRFIVYYMVNELEKMKDICQVEGQNDAIKNIKKMEKKYRLSSNTMDILCRNHLQKQEQPFFY